MGRDQRLDVVKGIAIALVIVGHVMQFAIPGFQNTFVFNIIWSLQIPLFMVLSGYFADNGKKVRFFKRFKKKLRCYLLPFLTYFILNVIFNYDGKFSESIRLLPWHLEISLWYLFVLFILAVTNDVATDITASIRGGGLLHTFIYFAMIAIWGIVMLCVGTTFLGAKYVVYYSVFFWVGWLWRYGNFKANAISNFMIKHMDYLYAVAAIIYVIIIAKINLFETADTLFGMIPRLVASMFGVFLTVCTVYRNYKPNLTVNSVADLGRHSLEMYYIHCLFVSSLPTTLYSLASVEGIITVMLYSVLVLMASWGLMGLIRTSTPLSKLLFGRELA